MDIAAKVFWGGRFERNFLDVRVFNAQSNKNITIAKCLRKYELVKKRAYDQRVREIEYASVTPLILSASIGFAKEAKKITRDCHPFYPRNRITPITLSFALLRFAIQCIRGASSSRGHAVKAIFSPVDVVVAEANILSC